MSALSNIPEEDWLTSNEHAFAIHDNFPVTEGHALVISKREVGDWFELTGDEQEQMMVLVGEVKEPLDEQYQPDGYNIGINIGPAAGQTIDHLHIHVIPRYEGDMDDPRGGVRHVIPERRN